MNEWKNEGMPNGTAGEFQSDSKPELQNKIKIQGILTSRIETRNKGEPYYYGFFKIPDQVAEIPVIFKKEKPTIPKGSQVEILGNWAKSNGNRPSFTATQYATAKEVFHG